MSARDGVVVFELSQCQWKEREFHWSFVSEHKNYEGGKVAKGLSDHVDPSTGEIKPVSVYKWVAVGQSGAEKTLVDAKIAVANKVRRFLIDLGVGAKAITVDKEGNLVQPRSNTFDTVGESHK